MNSNSEVNVERAAKSTLFFSQVKSDGKMQVNSRINCLALLHLHTDVEDTVATIKDIIATEKEDRLERDTLLLLHARNWRFHLAACGVILAGLNSSTVVHELWNVLGRGSWVSPQIAATAYLIDSRFDLQAAEAIGQESFNERSIVALAQLLQQYFNTRFTEKQEALIDSAKAKDRDDSGRIAVTWAEKARSLFTAT